MPIRKENRDLYAVDWADISFLIKSANDWQCQSCGVQCRRPDDPYDHSLPELTCAHHFNDYASPEIFISCLCAACHLRHDAVYHATSRRHNLTVRQHRAGQRQFALPWRLL